MKRSVMTRSLVVASLLVFGCGDDKVVSPINEPPSEEPEVAAVTRIQASDSSDGDWFGHSVDISGDRTIVCTPSNRGTGIISTYVFEVGGTGAWTEVASFKDVRPSKGHRCAVSISGDYAVVATRGEHGNVRILERDVAGSWSETAYWSLPLSGCCSDHRSAGISGDRAVVVTDDTLFVLERTSDAKWKKAATVVAGGEQSFNGSVSLSGDRIIVGTDGARASLLEQVSSGEWKQVAHLAVASEGLFMNVATSGDRSVVSSGEQVYLYERDGLGNWDLVLQWELPHGVESVSISGDVVVVGLPGESALTCCSGDGAAYVFQRGVQGWPRPARLESPKPREDGRYGISVGISGDRIIVGERGADRPGCAYIIEVSKVPL